MKIILLSLILAALVRQSAFADELTADQVQQFREQRAPQIKARKTRINTKYDSIAIIDIAREDIEANYELEASYSSLHSRISDNEKVDQANQIKQKIQFCLDLLKSVYKGIGFANGVVAVPIRDDERACMVGGLQAYARKIYNQPWQRFSSQEYPGRYNGDKKIIKNHLETIDSIIEKNIPKTSDEKTKIYSNAYATKNYSIGDAKEFYIDFSDTLKIHKKYIFNFAFANFDGAVSSYLRKKYSHAITGVGYSINLTDPVSVFDEIRLSIFQRIGSNFNLSGIYMPGSHEEDQAHYRKILKVIEKEVEQAKTVEREKQRREQEAERLRQQERERIRLEQERKRQAEAAREREKKRQEEEAWERKLQADAEEKRQQEAKDAQEKERKRKEEEKDKKEWERRAYKERQVILEKLGKHSFRSIQSEFSELNFSHLTSLETFKEFFKTQYRKKALTYHNDKPTADSNKMKYITEIKDDWVKHLDENTFRDKVNDYRWGL